jgi:hypothetical protein
MKLLRSMCLLALVVVALAATGCGNSKSGVAEARAAAGTVNGLCPVREEPVVEGNFLDHDGQKIGFCCPPCGAEFLKKPEAFLTKMRAEREKFGYVGK